MPSTVFWSWQSDKPGKVSRHFLKRALTRAVAEAGEELDLDESERPGLDHDTKGEPGMVSIPDSILSKIDSASVFVADLTPVACSKAGRYVANPNVLIELGFAKKALGPSQIVLIWNDAWGGCTPEDLPFDLRHRRMPFTYRLEENASSEEISRAEESLIVPLKDAIIACLKARPAKATLPSPNAIEARTDDPSVWFDVGAALRVNAGASFGPDEVTFVEAPRSFIRVIPSAWPAGLRPKGMRTDQVLDIQPLGDAMSLSWGPTKGGIIAYRTSHREENQVVAVTATQWFSKNGELWGFDGKVVYNDEESRPTLATFYIVECWARFLRRAAEFYTHYGVSGQFEVRLGITQLEGLRWPTKSMWRENSVGLETNATATVTVTDLSEISKSRVISAGHVAMREAFGKEPSDDELQEILRNPHRR